MFSDLWLLCCKHLYVTNDVRHLSVDKLEANICANYLGKSRTLFKFFLILFFY